LETNDILKKLKGMQGSALEMDVALEAALAWCNTYKTKLQKSGSQLEFNLRILQFVELIKEDRLLDATNYARLHFPKKLIGFGQKLSKVEREQ
jgi:hypothetical protein